MVAHTIDQYRSALDRGTVLVDRLDSSAEPRLLLAVRHEIVDGAGGTVAKRFGYVELWHDGRARPGNAPFLDYAEPDEQELKVVVHLRSQGWPSAREFAETWAVSQDLPDWYATVSQRRRAIAERTRVLVLERLNREIAFSMREAARLAESAQQDAGTREKRRVLEDRVRDLQRRQANRLSELEGEAHTQARPPSIAAIALVVPQGLLDILIGQPERRRTPMPSDEVERRAIDLVVQAERLLGREPEIMSHNNPGYDIRSRTTDGHLIHIEVKGRELAPRTSL